MNESNNLTRRQALKWAATGVALAGAAYIDGCSKSPAANISPGTNIFAETPLSPNPNPLSQSLKGWFDVTAFGAKGDGVTPDEGAVNRALHAAYANKGGVVWFPPGLYLIESTVFVQETVTLLGAGWNGGAHPQAGSWILTKTPGVNLQIWSRGTTVQGIGFSQAQPPFSPAGGADWKPLDHDFAILVASDDVFLKQIHLLPCTKGIKIQTVGRAILDHIFGQPLTTGIYIDNACDVVKVNNVHFWDFWSGDNSPADNWVRAHGTALQCLRADNPQFSNLFFLGYNRGIAFGASEHGVTAKFKIVNADCDYCVTALEITGSGTRGQLTNFSAHADKAQPGGACISVAGENITLFLSQVETTTCPGNAIRAQGKGTRVFASNFWAAGWNAANIGAPAFVATDGATIFLGRPIFIAGGHGAPKWVRDGANGGHVLTGVEDELICIV